MFHNDIDAAITCPGRTAASRCSKIPHPLMVDYLAKDQPRKDRQKEKRMGSDDTPEAPEIAATNSNNSDINNVMAV